jgi:carotenoid 1,2-hydratase
VQIGPNRLFAEEDALKIWFGGTPWRLTGRGPRLLTDSQLAAQFTFRPQLVHAPGEREFFSRQLAGAEHRWIIANPLCDVEGEIRAGNSVIPFHGRGYHDHNFGTGPIGPGIKHWFWGRVLLDDRCVTFHFARPRDWRMEPEVHLVEIDSTGAHEIDVDVQRIEMDWLSRTAWWLRYPRVEQFADVLRLENPRVIDSSPFYLRIMYDATLRGERAGSAFCEVAYPHRLRVPILGRMIEMSIDKRALNRV